MKPSLTILSIWFFGLVAFTASAQTGVWTTNAPMSARAFGAAATVTNKIYMIAGGDYFCGVYSTVQAYDPGSNVWTSVSNLPTPRYEFGAAECNGLIYAIGGNPGCGSPAQAFTNVLAYNPVSNSWSAKAPLPTGQWGIGVASVNGKVYTVGGFGPAVYCYNPATNGWTAKTSAPATISFGVVAAINGIIYAIGGSGSAGSTNVLAYNPTTDTWATKKRMPTARDQTAGAVVNGIIYVVGGANGSALPTVEAYNPVTDTWSTETPLPYALYGASAAAINGKLYVMGGFNSGNTTLGTVLSLTPTPVGPVLTNIVVTPSNPTIGVGTNQSFIATGYYNDGSSQVLTNGNNVTNLVWSSSSPAVASVNTNGFATGVTGGVTTITATSGTTNAHTTLTVLSAPSISAAPTNSTVSPGGSVTLSEHSRDG